MKNKQTIQVRGVLIGSVLFAITASVQAGSISGLTSFTANTTARASEVNGNFTTVQTAVNDNDSRLTTVEGTVGANTSNITTLQATTSTNSANISTLQSNPGITGNLTLPESTDANTGNIMKGSIPFLHDYGNYNTFLGEDAGNFSMSGGGNTASGYQALTANTTGYSNTAAGFQALTTNTTGNDNTTSGYHALSANTSGSDNTASGFDALYNNTSGIHNIALGAGAGLALTTGNYNIDIGNAGVTAETNTIRIGDTYVSGATPPSGQNQTFIAGIYGTTTASISGGAVYVDQFGQLGMALSSRRFKDHIHPMGDASEILRKLHPVTFYYKIDHDPKGRHLQYGLVAEDVAKIAPTLVIYGKDGKPDGVHYRFLAPMLLNQYQKQQKVIAEQGAMLKAQATVLRTQAKEIVAFRKQSARVAMLEKQMARINTILAMRQDQNKVASAAESRH